MTMSSELVFITGATGFIGFRVLATALAKGYRVRASVRRAAQAESLMNAASVKPYAANLEVVQVPSITEEGAFDGVLDGVTYIIHVASPLAQPSDDYERDIMRPALEATLSILKSANKVASIKRVVITSSIVGQVSFMDIAVNDTVIHDNTATTPNETGPLQFGAFQAYCRSKIAAHNATTDFVEREKPSFDVIRVSPSFVMGGDELTTSTERFLSQGTPAFAIWSALGNTRDQPTPGGSVHVDDIALLHVLALDPKIKGGQSFIATSDAPEGTVWDEQKDIIKRHFPHEVESGIFPLTGSQPSKRVRFDTSVTEKTFGLKFKSYEEQVKDTAAFYLKLRAAESSH